MVLNSSQFRLLKVMQPFRLIFFHELIYCSTQFEIRLIFKNEIFLKPQKYAHKIIPRISNIDIKKKY